MVGDWVNVNGLNLKVGAIHADEIGVFDPDYKIYWCSDDGLDRIDPIPLTEEILALNFGEDPIDYDHEMREHFHVIGTWAIAGNEPPFWFCHRNDWAAIKTIGIYYVHELQHILRLCNIDKEISI